MAVVKKGTDLGRLAQDENLAYIVVPKVVAESWRKETGPVQIRLKPDQRHPRLWTMAVRRAETSVPSRPARSHRAKSGGTTQ